MDKEEQRPQWAGLATALVATVLFFSGFVMVSFGGWWISWGVTLILWASNIEREMIRVARERLAFRLLLEAVNELTNAKSNQQEGTTDAVPPANN